MGFVSLQEDVQKRLDSSHPISCPHLVAKTLATASTANTSFDQLFQEAFECLRGKK